MVIKPGKLVVVDPQGEMKVLFDGVEVPGVSKLRILSDEDTNKVRIVMAEHPMASALRAAGILVKEI